MRKPILRPAVPDDLPGILALYRHLHPDDPELNLVSARSVWTSLSSSGLTTVFVAAMAGALVSSCTLAIIANLSRGARPYGVIGNVVTHSDHRRSGLGRAVLHIALDTAWKADCYKVMLATGSSKESTLLFYESVGFHRGGKTSFEVRRS